MFGRKLEETNVYATYHGIVAGQTLEPPGTKIGGTHSNHRNTQYKIRYKEPRALRALCLLCCLSQLKEVLR
jgi:uncharacterized protein (UPF0305 family)